MRILHIILYLCLLAPALNAADSQLGKNLHQENCISCHAAMTGGDGSVLYTRKDHKVTNVDSLDKQVHRCQSSLGLNWTTTQSQNVQQYLNDSFYHY
jgi:hypothetical protein